MQRPFLKRTTCIILVITLFLGLFLVDVNEAKAVAPLLGLGIAMAVTGLIGLFGGQFVKLLEPLAEDIFRGIGYLLLKIAEAFTAVCAKIFTAVLEFGFKDLTAVYDGWTITRDIVNMFFILGLIVIAFATILRVETYGMKALLPKIIIIALLINFSFLVCGIIIDTSQIATHFFINGIKNGDSKVDIGEQMKNMILRDTKVPEFADEGNFDKYTENVGGDFATFATAMLFTALVIFLAGFILLIGAVLLFVRIGALWILMILSPFAWFLGIFPKFKSMASKWWSNFLKYTFFAPIYVFFIYLVFKIAEQLNFEMADVEGLASTGLIFNTFAEYTLLVILLLGAPMVAMSMGIYGANAVMGTAKGALKGTYKLPGRLRKAMIAPPGLMKALLPHKLTAGIANVAKWTSPELWKQAIEERRRERMREARVPLVLGKQQDLLNRVLSIGQKRTTHAERAEEFEVQEREKEMLLDSKGVESALFAKFAEARKGKDIVDMKSAVRLLLKDKNHNDLILFTSMFDNMRYSDSELIDEKIRGKRVNPLGDAATEEERREGREYTDPGFKDIMYQVFAEAGQSESGTAAFMGALGEMGIKLGAYPLYHGGKMDETGKWVRTDDKEQAEISAAKYESLTLRDKGRNEHGTTYGTQTWDWKNNRYQFKDLSDSSRIIFKKISLGDIDKKRFYEMRDDSFRALAAAVKQLTKELRNPKLVEEHYKDWTPEDKVKIEFYEKRIDEYVTGKKEEGKKKKKKEEEEEE